MDAATRPGAIAKQSERASLIALDLARGLAAVTVMLVHVLQCSVTHRDFRFGS